MGQYPEAPCSQGHNPECVPGGTASGSHGPGAMRACSAPSSSGPWQLHLWDCRLHCSCNLDLMSPGLGRYQPISRPLLIPHLSHQTHSKFYPGPLAPRPSSLQPWSKGWLSTDPPPDPEPEFQRPYLPSGMMAPIGELLPGLKITTRREKGPESGGDETHSWGRRNVPLFPLYSPSTAPSRPPAPHLCPPPRIALIVTSGPFSPNLYPALGTSSLGGAGRLEARGPHASPGIGSFLPSL